LLEIILFLLDGELSVFMFLVVVEGQHFEFVTKLIDGNFVSSGVILKDSCQETLGEKKATNPKGCRYAFINPLL
jgi:hypothetical protein